MPLPATPLFPRHEVVTLELVTAPAHHQARLDDLERRLGPPGSGLWRLSASRARHPLFVPATIRVAGEERDDAQVRFAGHSSLCGPWSAGRLKLPLQIELATPIDGFHSLHAVPGYRDPSLLREKLALEVFAEAGVPALRAALCRLLLDHGEGPRYLGLYTLLESPTGRFLADQFGAPGGNLYEATGRGAEWRTTEPSGYVRRAGPGEGDLWELRAAMRALHAPPRSREAWRGLLETKLDIDAFLRWLAANYLLHNTDTYGHKAHNFWFYADPSRGGRLSFIPSDLGNAFTQRGPKLRPFFDRRGPRWPLIGRLLADPVYNAAYRGHLLNVLDGALHPEPLRARIEALAAVVEPYVDGPEGESPPYSLLQAPEDFRLEVHALGEWVVRRNLRAREAIARLP